MILLGSDTTADKVDCDIKTILGAPELEELRFKIMEGESGAGTASAAAAGGEPVQQDLDLKKLAAQDRLVLIFEIPLTGKRDIFLFTIPDSRVESRYDDLPALRFALQHGINHKAVKIGVLAKPFKGHLADKRDMPLPEGVLNLEYAPLIITLLFNQFNVRANSAPTFSWLGVKGDILENLRNYRSRFLHGVSRWDCYELGIRYDYENRGPVFNWRPYDDVVNGDIKPDELRQEVFFLFAHILGLSAVDLLEMANLEAHRDAQANFIGIFRRAPSPLTDLCRIIFDIKVDIALGVIKGLVDPSVFKGISYSLRNDPNGLGLLVALLIAVLYDPENPLQHQAQFKVPFSRELVFEGNWHKGWRAEGLRVTYGVNWKYEMGVLRIIAKLSSHSLVGSFTRALDAFQGPKRFLDLLPEGIPLLFQKNVGVQCGETPSALPAGPQPPAELDGDFMSDPYFDDGLGAAVELQEPSNTENDGQEEAGRVEDVVGVFDACDDAEDDRDVRAAIDLGVFSGGESGSGPDSDSDHSDDDDQDSERSRRRAARSNN